MFVPVRAGQCFSLLGFWGIDAGCADATTACVIIPKVYIEGMVSLLLHGLRFPGLFVSRLLLPG